MPIEAQLWGQLVLGLLGIASTIATGFMAVRLVNARRAYQESLHKKEVELEKSRQATLKANSELERAAAESQAIRDRSALELLKARAEARQGNELMDMVRDAFNRIADTNIADNEVQALTAAALNKNSETINLLTLAMNDNHREVITNLTDLTLKLKELPAAVDGRLSPFHEQVSKLAAAINGLSPLVQGLQLTLLSQFRQQIQFDAGNGAYTDEVKPT